MYTKEERRIYARNWYRKNRKKICLGIKVRRQKNLAAFRKQGRESLARWRKKHPGQAKEISARHRQKHRVRVREQNKAERKRRRLEVLNHYGKCCMCCGETIYEFLTIDHKQGGGTQHRKEVGRGDSFYRWLIKNDFPVGYRVLCYNCNCSFGHYGFCPHEQRA